MFWFKISAENHVSKLLQSVLLCPSLILPPPAMPRSICHYTMLQ